MPKSLAHMQIAMQQQMFAAARARSLTTPDGVAAMAAAYQSQLATGNLEQQQQQQPAPTQIGAQMDEDLSEGSS